MSTTLKIVLVTLAVVFTAAILLTGGILIGQNLAFRGSFPVRENVWQQRQEFSTGCRPGELFGLRPGAMRRAPEMLDRFALRGRGMMGLRFGSLASAEPLAMDEARQLFEDYIDQLGIEDLTLHEVMLFQQNGYAIVREQSTGMGAMQLLLDYSTRSVYPEYGPGHMWNLKYGRMGFGRGRGMMGWNVPPSYPALSLDELEMPIDLAQARVLAQDYLDRSMPGAQVEVEGMAFYGYYSFDYALDGSTAGILSVNGFSGLVWPHTWHGEFIAEMDANES